MSSLKGSRLNQICLARVRLAQKVLKTYVIPFLFSYLDLLGVAISPHGQGIRTPTRGHLHGLYLCSISFSAAICGQRMEFCDGRGRDRVNSLVLIRQLILAKLAFKLETSSR